MDGREVVEVKAAPCPKSPPKYPDLCGRRRLQLEVQILNREIGFLEEELQSLEGIQPVSTSCKEVDEFVGSNPDPLVPIDKKWKQSFRFWKWLGTAICFPFSLLCHPQGCQKRIRCSYCYPSTNCLCSLQPEFCIYSPLRDCCCFQCQCQYPHCMCECPQQCRLAECSCCCCSCFRPFCYRTSCCKIRCCGSSCCCCDPSSCFQLPSCRIPRCTCTCDFSHSCCPQSGCCFCPLVFSCCRMPRCPAWDLTFCMPWRWLCCCFPLQCCYCCHGVSCTTPRPSCPDYSCGCIWSCPKCTETRLCGRLCSTKASCITGCLC